MCSVRARDLEQARESALPALRRHALPPPRPVTPHAKKAAARQRTA
jgi:hypothetical protein